MTAMGCAAKALDASLECCGMRGACVVGALIFLAVSAANGALAAERTVQYILVNRMPGNPWDQNRPESITKDGFLEVKQALPQAPGSTVKVGIGFIFSYLNSTSDEVLLASLKRFLALAEETDTPVFVQLDGDNWWGARPDLWNWWDPSRPGYNPANRMNVEWTGWSPDDAIKIAWRNWGRQIRVLPPPNLMSPRYRGACRQKLRLLVPVVVRWWRRLPAGKRYLLAGVKVGHESSIGVNAWYYPHGNDLLDRPTEQDPTAGVDVDQVPSRGVAQIGYAAVSTAGIRMSGAITEADLAEVVRRHLVEQSRAAAQCGLPREKLFTHCGGWKSDELLYDAALNRYSCPGWSFYRHADDPRKDAGVVKALARSNAPTWGAVEWLYQGPREVGPWRRALADTLSYRGCRLVCIYNWEGIRDSPAVLEAIRQVVAQSVVRR